LTKEQEDLLVKTFYDCGQKAKKTSDITGINYHTVCRSLKKRGININTRRIVLAEERDKMVSMYLDGFSSWEIARHFGFLNVCVIKNLNKAGIVLRNRSDAAKTYSVNREYFKQVETKEKAYIYGLICSDGNMSKDSFTLAFQEKDKYILDLVKAELEFTGPINFRKKQAANKQNMWALRVHDKEFCSHLKAIGIVERKTSKISFPDFLDESLIQYFILGICDGDGCISYDLNGFKCYSITFSGSKPMLDGVRQKILDATGMDCSVRATKGSLGFRLTYARTSGIIVMNWIYQNRPKFFFKRKWQKFVDIVNFVEL
jgi:hypothetical protein